jgi:hypothetical protein
MPKKTYTQINSITLAAASSSITFSSIPATYRDLVLIIDGTTTTGGDGGQIYGRFNGDTGSNYSFVELQGGSTPASFSGTAALFIAGFLLNSSRGNIILQFMDCSATDKHKTFFSRANASGFGPQAFANRWANTSAITSMNFFHQTGASFASGTTFNLYGIEA